ncbi:MAG: ISAs1 family transposase [Ardenticatenaceae bacterium]|nr:ISAs1 family transposase [Ardenticatenaceae bacterium]MBE7529874.1 ISAs1 family transposase [Ardenticatenaceae bacterium]MBE7533027.1 ISAs1 family transposase [Ardenticatenaceae bacterium]
MQCIILAAKEIEGIAFNLADLAEKLNQLTDPRDKRGKVYELGTILTMIVLARLSGADKPYGIFEWIRARRSSFISLFNLQRGQTPCLNTIRTLLEEVVSLAELESVLKQYLHEQYGGQNSALICIDGKTMRGTIPKGYQQGVHLLSAYLAQDGIVLKQIEVNQKENEIGAGPALLESLYLKDKVVCADAMQTQRTFCTHILAQGGDYLLWVKDNQATLQADIEQFFVPPRQTAGWYIPQLPYTSAVSVSKGHGRLERRTLTLMSDEYQFINWPGLAQVFKLEREVTTLATGVSRQETVYGLTSCTPAKADAHQILEWTRLYWNIENGLHYRRDVTLHEDDMRTRLTNLAQIIALINNFVVGLAQKLGYSNLASARRYFDASIASQLFS